MKKTLLNLSAILSLTVLSAAMGCETESYQETVKDTSQSCRELILDFAQADGCSDEHIEMIEEKIASNQMTSALEGSATFCKLETRNGQYLVMKDDLPTLPLATVYFSLVD